MLQIVCITIAPSFLMAAIYSLPAKYAAVYGRKTSPVPPMAYSYLFITLDLFAIALQGAGAGIAADASNKNKTTQKGTNVALGGMIVQVASMTIFFILCADFIYRVKSKKAKLAVEYNVTIGNDGFEPKYQHIRDRKHFTHLIWAAGITCVFIYIRSIFRAVELGEGWNERLMINEKYFLVLESLMVALCLIPITLIYPGLGLSRERIKLGKDKNDAEILSEESAPNFELK